MKPSKEDFIHIQYATFGSRFARYFLDTFSLCSMHSICKKLSKHSPHYTNPVLRPDAWVEHEKRVSRWTRGMQRVIPVDTVLWHGTTREEPVFHPSRVTFFGLEPMISVWYTLEEAEKKVYSGPAFVYQYRVIKPILLDRYIPTIAEHPGVETCLHPQVVLHGYSNYNALMGPFDLSVELTLQDKDLECIQLEKRYLVEPKELALLVEFPVSRLELKENGDKLILKKVK